jgi:hypothetical protein
MVLIIFFDNDDFKVINQYDSQEILENIGRGSGVRFNGQAWRACGLSRPRGFKSHPRRYHSSLGIVRSSILARNAVSQIFLLHCITLPPSRGPRGRRLKKARYALSSASL